ncbi:protein of unknown function (plasmid) [Methylocella tundrae]|uniref:Uncharacterized protein n=1 Tax=Methylocella tundrae TaxID=227605 RepID=A0A4U8Z7Q1_METTU|nr:protein of unknown function [Methylocella tundrae]
MRGRMASVRCRGSGDRTVLWGGGSERRCPLTARQSNTRRRFFVFLRKESSRSRRGSQDLRPSLKEVTFCETFSGRAPGSAKDLRLAEAPDLRRFYEKGIDAGGSLGRRRPSYLVCHGGRG